MRILNELITQGLREEAVTELEVIQVSQRLSKLECEEDS